MAAAARVAAVYAGLLLLLVSLTAKVTLSQPGGELASASTVPTARDVHGGDGKAQFTWMGRLFKDYVVARHTVTSAHVHRTIFFDAAFRSMLTCNDREQYKALAYGNLGLLSDLPGRRRLREGRHLRPRRRPLHRGPERCLLLPRALQEG